MHVQVDSIVKEEHIKVYVQLEHIVWEEQVVVQVVQLDKHQMMEQRHAIQQFLGIISLCMME